MLDEEVNKRATELQVGKCLERISYGVSKKLGERPHSFQLNEPGFMDKDFKSEDAKVLKSGVEQLVEKLEIVSKVCLTNKKFKPKAEERLTALEEDIKKFVTKQMFFDEME